MLLFVEPEYLIRVWATHLSIFLFPIFFFPKITEIIEIQRTDISWGWLRLPAEWIPADMGDDCLLILPDFGCLSVTFLAIFSTSLVFSLLVLVFCCILVICPSQFVSCLSPGRRWRITGSAVSPTGPDIQSQTIEMSLGGAEERPGAVSGRVRMTSKARYLALDGLPMSDLFKYPGGSVD